MKTLFALAVALLALAGASCGGDGTGDGGGQTPAAGAPIPGGGLSIAEALASTSDEPLMVRGYVIADGEIVRLCDGLAESHPPQCAEPSLVVEGLDLTSVEGLKREGRRAWTDAAVSLLGTVEDGVLAVSKTSI